ncbi:MAG: DUF554 domain-containing protein [Anaerovoracaceae bacterium]
MFGVIVNASAIVIGSLVGVLLKKGIPSAWNDQIMKALGLSVLYIGITGTLGGRNAMVIIISMVIGTVIGLALSLDDRINQFGEFLESKVNKGESKSSFSEAFVTSTVLFCVGAFAIIASLKAGLEGDYQMLYTKAILDGIPAMLLASTLGIGVIFSALMVFIYQGAFVILAQYIAPYLGEAVTAEIGCIGSLIIIGMALNVMKISNLKIMNLAPAIFMPIIIVPIYEFALKLF